MLIKQKFILRLIHFPYQQHCKSVMKDSLVSSNPVNCFISAQQIQIVIEIQNSLRYFSLLAPAALPRPELMISVGNMKQVIERQGQGET